MVVKKPVNALVDILKEQIKEYKFLLEIAKKKQGAIIENNIEELEKLVKEEKESILRATRLENKRMQIISTLKDILGSEPEMFTLKEVTEKAPSPYKEELNNIYKELGTVIDELNKVNNENSSLVEQALKIINFTMESFISPERQATYSEKDPGQVKALKNILDKKA